VRQRPGRAVEGRERERTAQDRRVLSPKVTIMGSLVSQRGQPEDLVQAGQVMLS
jgi:hypothetical protein